MHDLLLPTCVNVEVYPAGGSKRCAARHHPIPNLLMAKPVPFIDPGTGFLEELIEKRSLPLYGGVSYSRITQIV